MVRKMMPWLVASGLFALAALAIQFGLPRSRTYVEVPEPQVARPAAEARDTLALPRLGVGESVAGVSAAFGAGVTPRRVSPSWRPEGEAWEWSEPAGRYAVAEFVNGALEVAQVRRPWNGNLPAVEAGLLPGLRVGEARAAIERSIGNGWPVGSTVGLADGGEVETCAWAIRDRGVGTGAVLWVSFQGDRAVAVVHPWAGR